jgi:hypothetical protein
LKWKIYAVSLPVPGFEFIALIDEVTVPRDNFNPSFLEERQTIAL